MLARSSVYEAAESDGSISLCFLTTAKAQEHCTLPYRLRHDAVKKYPTLAYVL